ncbi:hypothetical protein [Rhodococcus sp. BE178]|uniref:hypothetical protein n=1 Tax=Rhodococcus sp. BE178 TaxID=2817737 RepID=UPI003D1C77C2
MTGDHAELAAELKALAETVLDRLEPILQKAAAARSGEGAADAAAAVADTAGAGTGAQPACSSCSWCPLCALAALVRGEQHDLVTLLAGQGAVLLAVLREVLDDHDRAATGTADAPTATAPSGPFTSHKFVPIDVTIKH